MTNSSSEVLNVDRKRSKLRRLFTRLLILLVLGLVTLEIALRLFLGFGHPLLYIADPDCGYLPAPNQDVHRFLAETRINRFSMRSPDVSESKPPGTIRVLFLGDSVVFGTTFVDQSAICTSLLPPRLSRDLGRTVEVLNASTGGWAPSNEIGYLRSRGTFGSDMVIFLLNTDDLSQAFTRTRPGAASDPGYPAQPPLCATTELVHRYLLPRLVRLWHVVHPEPPQAGPGDFLETSTVLSQLLTAKQFAMRSHARLAIVYSPVRPGGPYDRPGDSGRVAQFKAWGKAQNVPILDLSAAYGQHPPDSIWIDSIHLKPTGQRVAADAVEPWLEPQLSEFVAGK